MARRFHTEPAPLGAPGAPARKRGEPDAKITDLLKPEGIKVGATAKSQDDAIDQLIALQDASGNIGDTVAYKKAILAREEEFSTAVGDGIAIPHAKTSAVKRPGLAAMTVPGGVEWSAPDDAPADLMFMIAAPEGQNNTHLEMLAQLSKLLMHQEFADALRAAKTPEEFRSVIDRAEAEREAADAAKATPEAVAAAGYPEVLAITACPTGIAHTYMAAENLEKKAKEMGVTLKAETQGSAGINEPRSSSRPSSTARRPSRRAPRTRQQRPRARRTPPGT